MAGTSLLALIDDIATILDDVSVMTKVAVKKTSGVLGDDLALNAQQVTGIDPSREIPVVLKVAKGSFINKLILVPIALLLSVFANFLIKPLLIIGGLFLCYEGFEKVYEKFKSKFLINTNSNSPSLAEPPLTENDKIKGAVRTDFILSAEIIVITLGTVASETLSKQILVLSSISILMTFGVYGLVGGIVKLDDLGLWLNQKTSSLLKSLGQFILRAAPLLMKTLGVVGTAAMFLVGGGLISHSIPFIYELQKALHVLISTIIDGSVGVFAGGLVVLLRNFLLTRTSRA